MVIRVPSTVAFALGALVMSAAAWSYLRWRTNLALAGARTMRHFQERWRLPALADLPASVGAWGVLVTTIGAGLAAGAVGLWAMLIASLACGRHNDVTLLLRAPPDLASDLVVLLAGLLFIALGAYHLAANMRWTVWYGWLCDVRASGDEPGPPPDYRLSPVAERRWRRGVVLIGAYLIGLGAAFAALGAEGLSARMAG